jgi:hypothetical protein
MTMTVESYFGGCPQCGKDDGYTNVGRSHWFFCKAHKTKWCIGANLFSSWRDETEDEQRRAYDEIGMGEYTEVEPLPCTDPELTGAKPLPESDNVVEFPERKDPWINVGSSEGIIKALNELLDHERDNPASMEYGYGYALVAAIQILERAREQADQSAQIRTLCPDLFA